MREVVGSIIAVIGLTTLWYGVIMTIRIILGNINKRRKRDQDRLSKSLNGYSLHDLLTCDIPTQPEHVKNLRAEGQGGETKV
jgi:hypothetical protein